MPQSVMHPRTRAAAPRGLVAVDGREFPLRSAGVDARAEGGIACTTLVQEYTNPYAEPLEVLYTLPLPADGAVTGYVVHIGERTIRGEVRPRKEAREEYRKAIVEGRSTSLLEQERADTFSQSLGSIPGGQDVRVEIEVLQPLAFLATEDERPALWEYRFPTVVGVRYHGASSRVPDRDKLDVDRADRTGTPVRLTATMVIADGPAGEVQPASTTHAIQVKNGDECAKIELSDASRLDRDLVVRWQASVPEVGLTMRTGGGLDGDPGRYALITVTPPAQPVGFLARDLTILLDASGSMSGEPLDQAKDVIRALLDSLDPQDRFELLAFANTTKQLVDGPLEATPRNLDRARAALDSLLAGGGTEMVSAIVEALAPLRDGAQRQVVVLTDGYIGFEAEVVKQAINGLGKGSRLHAVGIGSAPNRTLTCGMARAGLGVEALVGPGDDAGNAGARLCRATARPVLTELAVSGAGVRHVSPARLPDVLAGQPLVFAVELAEGGGTIDVRGRRAGVDERWVRNVPSDGEAPDVVSSTPLPIGALFGRWRIEDLELQRTATTRDRLHSRPGADPEITSEIEAVAMRHRIVSSETSLVAVAEEPSVDPRHPKRRVRLPVELPAGVSAEGVGLYGQDMDMMSLSTDMVREERATPARSREAFFDSLPESVSREDLVRFHGDRSTLRIRDARVLRIEGGLLVLEFEVPEHGLRILPGSEETNRIRVELADGCQVEATVDRGQTTAPGRHGKGLTIRLAVRLVDGTWTDGPTTLHWTAQRTLTRFGKVTIPVEIPIVIGEAAQG